MTNKTITMTVKPMPLTPEGAARLLATFGPLERYFGQKAIKVYPHGIRFNPTTAQCRKAVKAKAEIPAKDRNRVYQWLRSRRHAAKRRAR